MKLSFLLSCTLFIAFCSLDFGYVSSYIKAKWFLSIVGILKLGFVDVDLEFII
jgi:hypothetical protein